MVDGATAEKTKQTLKELSGKPREAVQDLKEKKDLERSERASAIGSIEHYIERAEDVVETSRANGMTIEEQSGLVLLGEAYLSLAELQTRKKERWHSFSKAIEAGELAAGMMGGNENLMIDGEHIVRDAEQRRQELFPDKTLSKEAREAITGENELHTPPMWTPTSVDQAGTSPAEGGAAVAPALASAAPSTTAAPETATRLELSEEDRKHFVAEMNNWLDLAEAKGLSLRKEMLHQQPKMEDGVFAMSDAGIMAAQKIMLLQWYDREHTNQGVSLKRSDIVNADMAELSNIGNAAWRNYVRRAVSSGVLEEGGDFSQLTPDEKRMVMDFNTNGHGIMDITEIIIKRRMEMERAKNAEALPPPPTIPETSVIVPVEVSGTEAENSQWPPPEPASAAA